MERKNLPQKYFFNLVKSWRIFINKNYALMIGTLIISTAIVIIAESVKELTNSPFEINESGPIIKEPLIALMAATVSLMTLFTFTLTYLNKKRDSPQIDDLYSDVQMDFSNFRNIERDIRRLKRISSLEIGDVSETRIELAVKEEIKKIAYRSILKSIKDNLRDEIRLEHDVDSLAKSISRMINEIWSLKTRGNLNLTIGIMITLLGIVMLGVFVFTSSYDNIGVDKFIIHFIPRISLVIFVQIFAFFFLKLYRNNMEEVKYFHNEITSAESRLSAVVLAKNSQNLDGMAKVVSQLSILDRNAAQGNSRIADNDHSIETLTKLLNVVAPLLKRE